jgi:hypothetical protein
VFFDVDRIPLGAKFKEVISDCLEQSAILLVVIGEQWVNPAWSRSVWLKPFYEQAEDYVQIEIEISMKLHIPIVPVLVGEMKVPHRGLLPTAICELCDLHAASVRSGRDFHLDMNHISDMIKNLRTNL